MRFPLLLLLLLTACGTPRPPPGEPAPTVASATDAVGQEAPGLQQARAQLAEAQAVLAAAQARVTALEAAQARARQEAHRRLLAWASGLAILGALICGAVAVFLPLMRARLTMAAVACGVVLVLAQTLAVALPWLPFLGLAAALLALLGLVVVLWARLQAAVRSVAVLADKTDSSWPAHKKYLLQAQGGEGSPVQRDLDRLAHRGAA